MNTRHTDEAFSDATIPRVEQQEQEPKATRKLIDIHVYDLPEEDEETHNVEGTAYVPDEAAQSQNQNEQTEPYTKQEQQSSPFVFYGIIILFVMIMSGGSLAYLFLFQTATITIIPINHHISTTGNIAVVTGTADPTKNQIQGRRLSHITISQEQTIPTTGQVHQEAQAAHGTITFYNAAPYSQTIAAQIILTGSGGIQVITNEAATIPAAHYPAFGQATVTAHAMKAGTQGNIKAGDIYGLCCMANVSAVNSAFSGGRDVEDYQSVAKGDIDKATASLTTSLTQAVNAALQTQVQPNETLITPSTCQQTMTTDHKEGDKATQLHTTISQTCIGMAYSTKDYQQVIEQIETQEAIKQLGKGYSLTGAIQGNTIQAEAPDPNTMQLQVKLTSVWTYQFTNAELDRLHRAIAGKSKESAHSLLSQVPGVQRVAIDLLLGDMLPHRTDNIHMFVISGAS